MTPLANLVASAVLLGVLGFGAWTVYVYSTSEVPRRADWTATVVYRAGQLTIWTAALLLAGGVFAASARAVWRLVE